MAGIVSKGFASPDEVRTPDKTRLEIVDLGGGIKAAKMKLPATRSPLWARSKLTFRRVVWVSSIIRMSTCDRK